MVRCRGGGPETELSGGDVSVNDDPVDSAPNPQWRPVAAADVTAMAVLLADIERADQYGWHLDADFLARWVADPMIDLARGSTAAFDGDRMVATGVLVARVEADPVHAMHYEGGVHPGYRGRGLGAALLGWAVRAAAPLHADRFPGQPLTVQCQFPASDSAAAELFAQYGFTPARYFRKMARDLDSDDLPPVRVPGGFEIVPYRADLDEPMRVAKNEAFRDHWDVTPATPEAWRSQFTGPEFRPALSPLAVSAATGQVVGLIVTHESAAETAATGRRDAHLNNVGTLREARGRGVATALIATTLRAAREHGYATASLGVDAENPTGALGVYEKSGFAVVDTWVTYARSIEVMAGS
jgi:mycothiol synthase